MSYTLIRCIVISFGLLAAYQVSGVRIDRAETSPGRMLNTDTSYETPPGQNSEQIEHQTLNVQHRTSNIDDATLLPILKQANRSLRGAPLDGQNTLFDVGRSMFDVHFLVNPSYETSQEQSFF